jgi:hypothetical protein
MIFGNPKKAKREALTDLEGRQRAGSGGTTSIKQQISNTVQVGTVAKVLYHVS